MIFYICLEIDTIERDNKIQNVFFYWKCSKFEMDKDKNVFSTFLGKMQKNYSNFLAQLC